MLEQFQIINKILQNKDYSIIELNNLSDAYFPDYKAEFNYVKDHYNKYKVVPDRLTFSAVFPEFQLKDISEPDTYLVDQLFEEYAKGYVAEQFNKIKDILESDNPKAGELALSTMQNVMKNLPQSRSMTSVDLVTDRSRYNHFLEKVMDKENSTISTGFDELDELIGGIDVLNEDMVIAARTGVGKSWILIKMLAAAFAQGKRVGLYSGEMHEDKVGFRFDTVLSGISNKSLNRGNSVVVGDYCDYLDKLQKGELPGVKAGGCVKVITPTMMSGRATVDALSAFIEKEKLEILFVDQYSLLQDSSKAKSLWEKVGNISSDIKDLQVLKRIPIISVTQLNRQKNGEEEDEQDTTQISSADRIGQDATTIIMLSKKPIDPDTDLPVSKMENGKTYTKFLFTLNVVKARDGGEGKLTYAIDLDTFDCTYFETKSKKNRSDDSSDSDSYRQPIRTEEFDVPVEDASIPF